MLSKYFVGIDCILDNAENAYGTHIAERGYQVTDLPPDLVDLQTFWIEQGRWPASTLEQKYFEDLSFDIFGCFCGYRLYCLSAREIVAAGQIAHCPPDFQ